MRKNGKRISSFSVAIVSALIRAVPSGLQAAPQQTPTGPQVLSNAVVTHPIHFDVSRPLAELLKEAPAQQGFRMIHAPMKPKLQHLTSQQSRIEKAASAVQPSIAPLSSATVGLSFEGIGNTSFLNCPSVAGFTVAPPDTNAAVGDTQVVEWVNVCYAVFDKSSGALIAGP
jgi:hypothetical protein